MSSDKLIKLNFGKAAGTYDKHAIYHKEIANDLIQLIYNSTKDTSIDLAGHVLDIGAGTGLLAEEFLKFFKCKSMTLNDISSEMLTVAASKYQKINIIHGNAEEIDLTTYDLIISSMSFQWFNDINFFIEKSLSYCKKIAFSIPIFGTFHNWYNLLDEFGLNVPIIKYKSRDEIQSFCDSLDLSYKKFDEKKYIMEFNSAKDFMMYLKLIGANVSGRKHSIDSIKNLLKIKEHLQVSYDIFFAVLVR